MAPKQSYDWLRHIEKALVDLDTIPLLGNVPHFDYSEFCLKLRELFQIPDLEIEADRWTWQSPDSLLENLGKDPTCINMAVLPLQGHVSLMIGAADLNSLTSWIVEHKSGSNVLVSSQFTEGLLNFVVMEAMHLAQPHPLFKNFMLRIIGEPNAPSSRSLVLDMKFKAYKEEVCCKLVVPESFRRFWLEHFETAPKHIPPHMAKTMEVVCSLEAARVAFTHKEWKSIRPGDFIPLNSANLDLENGSGSLLLSVSQKPLVRVRIKNKGLKILEQPLYQEDTLSMDNDNDDLLSEISDLEQDKKQTLDPIPEEIEQDEAPISASEEDSSQSAEEEERIEVSPEKSPLEKIEMVPLNVVVEVARFKMTCEKLIQLKPGNLLELNVALEKPVNLIVNGKKIATGELVRIGDSLGVQVTEVG